MPIVLKTRREIEMMRRAGQVGCEILRRCATPSSAGRHDAGTRRAGPSENWTRSADRAEQELSDLQAGRRISRPRPASASTRKSSTASPATALLQGRRFVTLDLALQAQRLLCRHRHDRPGRQDRPGGAEAARCDQARRWRWRSSNMKPGSKWSDIARLMQYNVESNGFQRGARVRRPRHRPIDARRPEGRRIS